MNRPAATTTPQHSGRSTPSTFSTFSAATSLSSYPGSGFAVEHGSKMGVAPPPRERAESRPSKPSRLLISPPEGSGSVSVTRSPSSHGKLHKRGSSASSLTSPLSAFPAYDVPSDRIISPPAPVYQDARPSTRVKIKPLLRKLSSPEKRSLDLSRSAAENEDLGMYTSSGGGRDHRGGSDAGHGAGLLGLHTRTTSGASQLSTTTSSSHHRPGAQYVHPMRQLPQPYTPPVAHSYRDSLSSELSRPTVASDDTQLYSPQSAHYAGHAYRAGASAGTTPVSYGPLLSSTRTPPPLHIRTHSSSRVTAASQGNVPGTPSSLRYADSLAPDGAAQPPSRSSFDSMFRKRSRTNTATDPVARQATVLALRAEFDAKEAAEALKIDQAEARVREREARRRAKRDESARRKGESADRKRSRADAASEKSVPMSAVGYNSTHTLPVVDVDLDGMRRERPSRTRMPTAAGSGGRAGKAGRAVGSRWSLFWFQLGTLWIRFKLNMRGGLP